MRAYRIADERFPIFDGTGAKIAGARWNSPGRPVIYAAETFAGAMLEILVHAAIDRLPKTYVYVELGIPDAVVTESTNLAQT
jgi:RES domain-containing protein